MDSALLMRCFRLCLFGRNDGDERTVVFLLAEGNNTVYQSEQGVVLTNTDVFARMVNRTTLTDQDVAGNAAFSTENLNAQSFAF